MDIIIAPCMQAYIIIGNNFGDPLTVPLPGQNFNLSNTSVYGQITAKHSHESQLFFAFRAK